jgi:hypothetical protein
MWDERGRWRAAHRIPSRSTRCALAPGGATKAMQADAGSRCRLEACWRFSGGGAWR